MGKKNLENGETENASDGSVRKMQRIDKFLASIFQLNYLRIIILIIKKVCREDLQNQNRVSSLTKDEVNQRFKGRLKLIK